MENLGITKLKVVAKELGIRGYSHYRTATKLELIQKINEIQKSHILPSKLDPPSTVDTFEFLQLPPEIQTQIIDFLSDEEKIDFVAHFPQLHLKPHLTEILSDVDYFNIEEKIKRTWNLQSYPSITDLFYIPGVYLDVNQPIPDKYKNSKILSRFEIVDGHKYDVLNTTELHVRQLTPNVEKFKNLEILHITSQNLSTLPEWIGDFKKLRVLVATNIQLTQLPSSIGQLRNLETLGLSENRLTRLPDEMKNLKNLKHLYLRVNRLTELSPFIGELTKLEFLDVSFNPLTTLPDTMFNLHNLRQIDVRHTRLTPESRRIATRFSQRTF